MNNSLLQQFRYHGTPIQVLGSPDQPSFIAKEICNALGISNHRDALNRLDDDEKGVVVSDTPGGKQEILTINEPGMYSLVLRSNKPEAKKFKRWVTHEVLPAIRKKGYYATPGAVRRMVRQELAKERLAEHIHYSDIWDEEKAHRLAELKKHLTNTELAKVFDCSVTTVRRVHRLYRHAKGDFEDKRPESLKPDEKPQLSLLGELSHPPASPAVKEDIYRMREHDDLTYQQIADMTGFTPESCRQFYLKEKMRREADNE